MIQAVAHMAVALPWVSLGPLKPLQMMLYLSKEIMQRVQMLHTPVTAPVGEKKERIDCSTMCCDTLTESSIDLTVGAAEHPHAAGEAVVAEEGEVGGQHDQVLDIFWNEVHNSRPIRIAECGRTRTVWGEREREMKLVGGVLIRSGMKLLRGVAGGARSYIPPSEEGSSVTRLLRIEKPIRAAAGLA
ncbi:hypothetical protein E2C01_024896 [Portunus trituberculatus]|uniref:Uncharacterized protein n=1 Tax=Portunus trituberculatus TaxID=210409 RepID=A0A5B7EF40_PORTR|nr:hypothetical protein [Portunus trituberculatus]